jgi:hypothetical protein
MIPANFSFFIQSDNLDNISIFTKYLSSYAPVVVHNSREAIIDSNGLYFIDIIGLINKTSTIPQKSDYFLFGSWENISQYGKTYRNIAFQDYLLTPLDYSLLSHKVEIYFLKKESLKDISPEGKLLLIANLTEKLSIHSAFLQEYIHLICNKVALEKMESTYPIKLETLHHLRDFHLLSINVLQKSLELLNKNIEIKEDLEGYTAILESYFTTVKEQLSLTLNLHFSTVTPEGILRIFQILYIIINSPKINKQANYFLHYYSQDTYDEITINKAMDNCLHSEVNAVLNYTKIESKNTIEENLLNYRIQFKNCYGI